MYICRLVRMLLMYSSNQWTLITRNQCLSSNAKMLFASWLRDSPFSPMFHMKAATNSFTYLSSRTTFKRACCGCPDLSHFSNAIIALTARGLSWSYFKFNGCDLKTTSLWLGYIMTPFTIFRYISLKCAVTRRISVPCIDRHQASWAFHCPSCASMHEPIAWLKSSATSWASDSSLNFSSSPAPCFLPPTCRRFA